MPNSPKKSPPRTRKTYTRRSPKTKIHEALDELRDLIDRHCGAPTGVVPKTAIAQQKAALTTQVPYDPFSNLMGPVENATIKPYPFNASAQFVPTYGTPNAPYVRTNTYPVATTAYDPFANFNAQPMPQVMPQPTAAEKIAKKVTCPHGPRAYNEFVANYIAEQRATGRNLKYQNAIKEIKRTGAYKAKCILDGTAKETGTGRKGRPGKPVSENIVQSLLAAAKNPFNTPPKQTRRRKAAQPIAMNKLLGSSTNVPITKRKYTKKVKVQAPGNIVPVTPGRNNLTAQTTVKSVNSKLNPFTKYNEPIAETTTTQPTTQPSVKPNNFSLFGTTNGNTNSFGFNQSTNTIGKINALQQQNTRNSSNSYEYIGEPDANGNRKIRIAGEDYFLTSDDNRLYPDVDGDFGVSVGVFDKNIKGFIREED